ncbi:MAG: peptide synthetase [Desulfobacca sp.]|nr:peptide synthetase [Desulfobacca sp.]
MEIRKIVTILEETHREMGQSIQPVTRKAAALAVIKNPFADRFEENLDPLIFIGEELGALLAKRCLQLLGIQPNQAQSYGKGAIVGNGGELEHAGAILHPKLGGPFREILVGGKAIIPSAKKMGIPGTWLDVPVHYKDAAFVRSHFDAMTVSVYDAPRHDEIVVVLVVTDSGRPLARIGGLSVDQAKKEDGLR